MLKPPRVLFALVSLVTGVLSGGPAWAVMKLDLPMTKVYETSKAVLVGKVADVQAESRMVEVREIVAVKGAAPGPQLRLALAAPAELIKQVAVGQPVVVFISQAKGTGLAEVHLADTWLLAQGVSGSNGLVWRVVRVHEDVKPGFPGRTVTLVRLLDDLKAGRNPLLDKFERQLFASEIRLRAKLKVQRPVWLLAADFNGDKQPDLLIGTAGGTRLWLASGSGYIDQTESWGAWGAAGGYRAVGDVNGDSKPDLLLDDRLWINDGRKFTAAKARFELPGKSAPLAAALLDVTGDGKPDALLLNAQGELRVFQNPGTTENAWPQQPARTLWAGAPAPVLAAFGDWGDTGKPHVLAVSEAGIYRYALDAAGGAPTDLERLTGVNLTKNSRFAGGLKNVQAVVLDADRNGRPDLFAVCDGGGLILINRGLGAFLLDDTKAAAGPFLAKGDYRPPFKVSFATPWTAAALHGNSGDDLLVLTEDGTLYEVASGK